MKIRVMSVLSIMLSFLCLTNANAATNQKKCPAGYFCTTGGTYIGWVGETEWFAEAGPAYLANSNTSITFANVRQSICGSYEMNNCDFFVGDYDEIWISNMMGFYVVKNGNVQYVQTTQGVLPCPGSYPSSAAGASSVFECYKIIGNGQKEYYKTPTNTQTSFSESTYSIDIVTVNALVKDLQSALTKAQSLQNVLSKSNQTGNNTNKYINTDIEKAKAMINAGISDAKVSVKTGTKLRK